MSQVPLYRGLWEKSASGCVKRTFQRRARTASGGWGGKGRLCGDTTPCRMTGVTLHSHVRYTSGALPPETGVGARLGEAREMPLLRVESFATGRPVFAGRHAGGKAHRLCVSLNSRLESNTEDEERQAGGGR